MHTFIFSIVFSVSVSVFLKLARRWEVDVAQAIAAGYIAASALCLLLLRPTLDTLLAQSAMGWGILVLLGVLLPSVFLAMAAAVRHAGIVRSDTAQRLSLVIPLAAAFLIFGESMVPKKLVGIALALCALGCLLQRQEQAVEPLDTGRRALWALLGVWVGYGVIDILFKQMARLGAGFTSTLLLSFILAAILIFGWLLARRRTEWSARSLGAGLLLGGLNFGNIFFYIRAHQYFPDDPTLVFASMNIGVISLGALVGAGFFHERLSRVNMIGIGLAIGAIVLLFPN